MEKQKHEREVLMKAKRVALANNAHKATPRDSQERQEASHVKRQAVDALTKSVAIAERAGVNFDGGGEP